MPLVKKKIVIKPICLVPHSSQSRQCTKTAIVLFWNASTTLASTWSVTRAHTKEKGEEALRDLLLMQLAPHFQSVTGETFNKAGKTDILIRHEKSNLFVAECKLWKGPKGYLATIDQALGYLTWRDSKAAVICFVRSANLEPVLQAVKDRTAEHTCFVRFRAAPKAGWFDFDFHIQGDPTRPVRLAVLCFHLPGEVEEASSEGE